MTRFYSTTTTIMPSLGSPGERPQDFPYGLITEEVVDWRARRLLSAMAQATDAEKHEIVRKALWGIALESSHIERGGKLGVPALLPEGGDL